MRREEYPRPQLVRKDWQLLNGTWEFVFDDHNNGLKEHWYADSQNFDRSIEVPFVYQSELSGIGVREVHDIVWYRRQFTYEKETAHRCLLHFGAVDYQADVYVDGRYVGRHIGGHTSFHFDITDQLLDGAEHWVAVRAWDPHEDEMIPRGKQFWEPESRGIWYTNSTGIWQSVWLETVHEHRLESIKFTPDVDEGTIGIESIFTDQSIGDQYELQILFDNKPISKEIITIFDTHSYRKIDLFANKIFRSNFHDNGWTWTPETPNLFDVIVTLIAEGTEVDRVESYFGMRKIHTEKGMVFLNNRPYYQKLVLDQGYWPEGLLTAPDDEAFIKDIELAKEMGFNGCRKHQKVEDPRFLYWADKLGYLVWGECASAPVYSNEAVSNLTKEWLEIVERDYNHPAIVTWVPLNESWGVPDIHLDKQQQSFSVSIYRLLHALDATRLVISNDGWEMTETDICAIHNYSHGAADEKQKYEHFKKMLHDVEGLIDFPPGKWDTFAKGFHYEGQPILLTEFGGVGYKIGEQAGWGYTSVETETDFVEEYQRIMTAVYQSEALWGFCYTQLTDVEQEINGLLTYDRQPKTELANIRKANDAFHPERIFIGEIGASRA